jgi:plastin-1
MSYQVDVKLIQTFKAEDYSELEKIFKDFDKNRNGVMETSEFVDLLHALGHRNMTQADANNLMSGAYLSRPGQMTYEEFLNVMKKLYNKEEVQLDSFVNKAGKAMFRVSKGDDTQVQTFSQEERAAYSRVINSYLGNHPICKKYLPINPDSNEVFDRIKDGVLLCYLINEAQEGTIDERVINKKDNMNVFQQVENLNLAISAAKSIGLRIIGLNYDNILDGKNYIMVLGLLWQIVKVVVMRNIQLKMHPELIRLLNPGEQLSDLLKLSPEQLLLRWFNYHLKAANYPKKITNFSGDVKDSEKYTVLLHQLNKNLCDNSALHDTDLRVRARKVIDNSKKLGAESYITPDDICAGNSKLNTLFVASIFNAYPGLDPPTEEEIDAAKMLDDDIEGAREERAFRMWINSLGLNDQDGNVVYINNLYEESKDGLVLLRTLEKVKPSVVNWKIVDQRPNNVFKRLINCNEVIDASKRSKYQIIGIGGQDIRDGNKKYILAIVWQMMRAHSLQIIGNQTEEGLIAWGNSLVDDSLKIRNLKDKRLGNSLYFINIMKTIEPRAIDWDIVITDRDDDESRTNNAKYALSIARKLGATVFLVWEDIAEVKSKLILTFLASIYDVASKYSSKY